MFERDYIGVDHLFHDHKLPVFVSSVLVDLFYGHCLAGLLDSGAVDDAETAVASYFAGVVGEVRLFFLLVAERESSRLLGVGCHILYSRVVLI